MTKRLLLTGANGFVGRHALKEFNTHGYEVFEGFGPGPEPTHDHQLPLDLLNLDSLCRLVADIQPTVCLHLAGQAHIPFCRKDPVTATDLNVTGTVRLLEAFRRHAPEARILGVTSAEVYGRVAAGHQVKETDPLKPTTLYGITKQAADQVALAFHDRLEMSVMTARPWNHIGPGQHPRFVAAAFARQFAAFAKGAPPEMRTGNLDSQRDFTDVRDIVRGYRLILENGTPGQAYNLSSSTLRPIRSLVDGFAEITGIQPTLTTDPELFRPTDTSPLLDTSRIRKTCGWTAEIPLETSLRDILQEHLDADPA